MEKIRLDEEIEKKLAELAKILNSFKSEAVQLRILDYVLGQESQTTIPNTPSSNANRKISKRPASKAQEQKPDSQEAAPKRKKVPSGAGAPAALTQLLAGNFFDTPRTINDIIEHCKNKMARTYRSNEFSGKLSRLARNGELIREKNADGQYEYQKP